MNVRSNEFGVRSDSIENPILKLEREMISSNAKRRTPNYR